MISDLNWEMKEKPHDSGIQLTAPVALLPPLMQVLYAYPDEERMVAKSELEWHIIHSSGLVPVLSCRKPLLCPLFPFSFWFSDFFNG